MRLALWGWVAVASALGAPGCGSREAPRVVGRDAALRPPDAGPGAARPDGGPAPVRDAGARLDAGAPPAPLTPQVVQTLTERGRLRARVDAARGIVVARVLGCENDEKVADFVHACGGAIDRKLAPVAEDFVRRVKRDPNGIVCRDAPRPECRVPPTSECEPAFTVIFAAPAATSPVIAIIERDDWQERPEEIAATDRRVNELLTTAAAGCVQ